MLMLTYNANKLGKLLSDNIMIFHDNADYNGMQKNTENLIQEMGYDKKIATQGAKRIKEIYINYDLAQQFYEKKDYPKENSYYNKSKALAKGLNKLLKAKYDTILLVEIVYNWRHGKKLNALFVIFWNWMQKLNYNFLKAVQCTYYMVKAAKAHDSRNYKKFKENFTKIYEIIISTKPSKIPLLF